MKKVEKLSTVPAAFSVVAEKINEIIGANRPLKAGRFIKLTESNENLLISADLTSEEIYELIETTYARTFYAAGEESADILVSAGTINNVYVAETTISAPSNGDKIYIDATVTAGTSTVTAATVAAAATVPANTATKAYTLLASVVVADGVADAVPVAWNYSQLQRCGGSNYLWGGFGA